MAADWQSSGGGTGVLAPSKPRVRTHRVIVPSSCPPFDPPFDDDEGGGGGGGGGRWEPTPPGGDESPTGAAEFGLGLALVGIATIFGVFLLAWVLLRKNAPDWPAALSPAPGALWLSTLLLLSSSLTLQAAVDGRGDLVDARQRRALGFTVLLGLGFLAAQALLWRSLAAEGFLPSTGGYGSIFYALTGLHAVHVLVGVGVLMWLFVRAHGRAGLAVRRLRLGATYWHSMGAIWIVLFLVLYLLR